MKKKLSPEALEAIEENAKKVTYQQLEDRFAQLEKSLIKNIRENLNDYLTTNKYRIEDDRVKNYKKKMRNAVKLILEKYYDFSVFMKNFDADNDKKATPEELEILAKKLNLFCLFEESIEKKNKPIITKYEINVLSKEQLQKAKEVKQFFDSAFDLYKEKALKKLKVIPVISEKPIDYETIEANDQESRKMKRKLILLQKVYIEGKSLEEIKYFDPIEYIGSKNYHNDVNSLIDDLMILIFGFEGFNFIFLERLGFELL